MEFFGLIGEKLGHSLSEVIHTRLFELLSLPAAYKLMEIEKEQLHEVGPAIRLLHFKGINVTIPYKEWVVPQLDEIDVSARHLMAVNTIKNENGKLTGYNTDVHGLMELFHHHGIEASGKPAVVLGSGGAAKAALEALHQMGASQMFVASRSPEGKTASFPNTTYIDYLQLNDITGGVLLNATPVGMWPKVDACPVSRDIVSRFDAVVDTIYNPWETQLLTLAKGQGKPHCNGFYMLVAQAIRAEEIFWDRSFPTHITDTLYQELAIKLQHKGGV